MAITVKLQICKLLSVTEPLTPDISLKFLRHSLYVPRVFERTPNPSAMPVRSVVVI